MSAKETSRLKLGAGLHLSGVEERDLWVVSKSVHEKKTGGRKGQNEGNHPCSEIEGKMLTRREGKTGEMNQRCCKITEATEGECCSQHLQCWKRQADTHLPQRSNFKGTNEKLCRE